MSTQHTHLAFRQRVTERLRGFVNNLKFSNRFQITYDRLFRQNMPLSHYIWKKQFYFICNTQLKDHIALQEIFCLRAYDTLLSRCSFPDNRISYVNIGAHIGAFDVLLLERGLGIENGLSVELNPFTLQRCQVNFHANGLFRTQLVNAGVAGGTGSVRLVPSRVSLSDNIFAAQDITTERESVWIRLLTLEELLHRYARHYARFDLIKLDCEGAEYPILRMTPIEVLQKFRYLIVEFHSEPPGESAHGVYAKLWQAGFTALRDQPGEFRFTELFTNER